jgi:hypothetical protein
MREFDSETGETIALHTEGMEGDVADDLLLWERPVTERVRAVDNGAA